MTKFLRMHEAARILQLSEYTIRDLDAQGVLVPARRMGKHGQRQYTMDQLREYSLKVWGTDLTKGELPDKAQVVFLSLGELFGELPTTKYQRERFDDILKRLEELAIDNNLATK